MRIDEVAAPSRPCAPGRAADAPAPSRHGGRPTLVELERRKTRAMLVATDLFVEQGYAATSLADIAKRAGVATRTLYQHFGDKEAMFREVIYARESGAIVPPPTLQPGDTIDTALRRAARYVSSVTFRSISIGLMRLMVAESNRFPDLMRQVATSTFARLRRNVTNIFEALAAEGLLPDSDHARSALLFTDPILGNMPMMTYTSWETSPPDDRDLQDRVDLFILGRFGAGVARAARRG